MPISVEPLDLNYSFVGTRTQAQDRVDLAQLDSALAQVTAKLNEIITAINQTTRDDDTLHDNAVEPRNLAPEVYTEIEAIVRGTSQQVPP